MAANALIYAIADNPASRTGIDFDVLVLYFLYCRSYVHFPINPKTY
jgi:hypothetical protein